MITNQNGMIIQKHDRHGLIKCANCGFVKTANNNGICDSCLRDYKNYGMFLKYDGKCDFSNFILTQEDQKKDDGYK